MMVRGQSVAGAPPQQARRNKGSRHMTAGEPAQRQSRGGRGGHGQPCQGGRRRTIQPNLPNDINAPSQRHIYHRFLLDMMKFIDNKNYPDSQSFTG